MTKSTASRVLKVALYSPCEFSLCMFRIVMAERVSPSSVVPFKANQIPANMVLVAAITAHCKEAKDGHLANQAEKVATLLAA